MRAYLCIPICALLFVGLFMRAYSCVPIEPWSFESAQMKEVKLGHVQTGAGKVQAGAGSRLSVWAYIGRYIQGAGS